MDDILDSASARKKRKVITLDQKIEIIRRYEEGDTKAKLGRQFGLHEATVRSILKQAEEYKRKWNFASTSATQQTTRNRSATMIAMERLLSLWIEECILNEVPLDTNSVKTKALSLYAALKKDGKNFTASSGWLERFKKRSGLLNVRTQSDQTRAKTKYPEFFNLDVEDKPRQCYDKRNFTISETVPVETPSKSKCKASGKSTPETSDGKNDLMLLKFTIENIQESCLQLASANLRTACENIVAQCANNALNTAKSIISDGKCLNRNDSNVPKLNSKQDEMNGTDLYVNEQFLPVKKSSVNEFKALFRTVEFLKQQIMRMDPNTNRGTRVCCSLDSVMSLYGER